MVAWVLGLLRLVGEGDGRDLLEDGLEDADLELGAVNLKKNMRDQISINSPPRVQSSKQKGQFGQEVLKYHTKIISITLSDPF